LQALESIKGILRRLREEDDDLDEGPEKKKPKCLSPEELEALEVSFKAILRRPLGDNHIAGPKKKRVKISSSSNSSTVSRRELEETSEMMADLSVNSCTVSNWPIS
jgi:hypothetical protein